MSKVQVDKVVNLSDDGAPQLTYGAELPVGYGLTGAGGLNITGVVTAASAVFSGNVTIGGTLTYEDVTNIDVVGVSTFAGRMNVNSTINANEGIKVIGVSTLAAVTGTTGTFSGAVSGTTGTFSGDVDIADKIVHTGDTNTAIRFPSADTITAETGGSERFRINSSGNVSIGNNPTVASDTLLHVEKADELNVIFEGDTTTLGARLTLKNNNTDAGAYNSFEFADAGGQSTANIIGYNIDQTNNYGELAFATRSAQGSPPAERFRVNLSGTKTTGIGTFTGNVDIAQGSGQAHYQITQTSGNTVKFGIVSGSNIELSGTSNNDMYFKTYDKERLRIEGGGFIGVGTDNPGVLFDVWGTGPALGSFHTKDGTTGSEARISLGALQANPSYQRGVNLVGYNNGAGHDFVVQTSNSHNLGPTEKVRVASDGDVGVGTASPGARCHIFTASGSGGIQLGTAGYNHFIYGIQSNDNLVNGSLAGELGIRGQSGISFSPNGGTSVLMRLASGGNVYFGSGTTLDPAATTTAGVSLDGSIGFFSANRVNDVPMCIGRAGNDGLLVRLHQGGTEEGNISVSGSTVSYNGGHLSRWSQLVGISTNVKSDRPTIYQGTVMSNLDAMCEWPGEDNQQLNKTKVSDSVGDKDVAGVFWAWDDDDEVYTNDFYVAMTGDMVVRVGAATTIARGDLLESAGDGTAKPQADDIVRSKTVAKITSTTSTATYADGSKAYPCVLMAC